MFKFLKRIGRRLGLVKAASGGEMYIPATVNIYVRSAFEANSDAIRKLIAEHVRRAGIANQNGRLLAALTGPRLLTAAEVLDRGAAELADQHLQRAAEQFAAVVIDALQHG